MADFLDAIAGLIGTNQTNAANTSINNAQMAFNADEAQKNRDFQQYNSNTQYQRGTQDMIAAGINPMLAISNGGAGNLSGATASSGSMIPMQNKIAGALAAKQAVASIQNTESATKVNEAEAVQKESATNLNNNSSGKITQEMSNLKVQLDKGLQEIENLKAGKGLTEAQTKTEGTKQQLNRAQAQILGIQNGVETGRIGLIEAQTQVEQIRKQLLGYDLPESKNNAGYYEKTGIPSAAAADLGKVLSGVGQLRSRKGATITNTTNKQENYKGNKNTQINNNQTK